MENALSRTEQSAMKTLFALLKELKDAGGELPIKELLKLLESKLDFTEWELERYEKSGYIRWQTIMTYWSVGLIKAGLLRKRSGIWFITDEGEKALKLGEEKLLDLVHSKYREWKKKRDEHENEDEVAETDSSIHDLKLDELEDEANNGLKNHIKSMTPYEFQDLVAALLKAMGYYIPFIASKGKDGGIDIVAYQDPLGAKSPRIKVQVKHHPDNPISVKDIRSLTGLINKDGEIGLFVTSGKFSNEAERFARESHIHIKLIDFIEFISLWKQFYAKLTDEEKNMLPLHPIYFLGTNE